MLVSLLLAAGCSGPTAPTSAPPTAPAAPPPNPVPPLSVTCPADVTTTMTGATTAVTFSEPVASGGLAPVQVSCTRQSGSPFAVGATPVQCTAADAASTTASCVFTVTVTAAIPRLSRTRFLAFGDSLTSGEVAVPTSTTFGTEPPNYPLIVIPSASYPAQTQSLLRARYTAQATAIEVTNAGLSGEWAEDGAKRFPGVMASVRPEAVFLFEGGNDVAAQGQVGVTRAWQALDVMAKEARNRGARVFIATLPPPRPGGPKTISAALIVSLNDRIKTTAAGEGAVLVDLYTPLATDVTRFVGIDGLHLTEAGYLRVAELFLDAVKGTFEVPGFPGS